MSILLNRIKFNLFFLIMISLNFTNYACGEQKVSIIEFPDKTIEIKVKNVPIESVLKSIHDKTKITFDIYKGVDKTKKITIDKRFSSLRIAIGAILQDFNYSIVESSKNIQKIIVLSSDKKKGNLQPNNIIQKNGSEKEESMVITTTEKKGMDIKHGKTDDMIISKSVEKQGMDIKK